VNGGKKVQNFAFNINWSYYNCYVSVYSSTISLEVSDKGGYKVKGISLKFDIIFIILLFLLVAITIIGFIVFFYGKIKEGLESGEIWKWIENLFKKGLGR